MQAVSRPQTTPAAAAAPEATAAAAAALDYAPHHTGNVGLVGLLIATACLILWGAKVPPAVASAVLLAAAVLPMVLFDVLVMRTYREGAAGLRWNAPRHADLRRVAVKLLGFLGTLGLAALAYATFAEYRKDNYQSAFAILASALWVLLPAAPFYFWWVDGRQAQPHDGFWNAGLLLLGRWRQIDRNVLRQYALGWLVKAFYLPLMLGFLVGDVQAMLTGRPFGGGFFGFFEWSSNITGAFDLLFGTIGYALTFRVLNSHIRSTEPTALGWTSAVMCYQPFWAVFDINFLRYTTVSWDAFLPAAKYPVIHVVWGSALLVVGGIFTYATVCFGLRFSNLTHRGIVRTGLYSVTKHPAYVAKIASYLLAAVPFVTVGRHPMEAVRQCLLLAGVAAIYRVRAVTEERHLMRDPAYRAYAEEIRRKHARWAARLGLGRLYQRLCGNPAAPEVSQES